MLLGGVVGRPVDRAPVGRAALRLERLAPLERVDARLRRFGDRSFLVAAWHEAECTLGPVAAALAVSGLVKRYGNVGALAGVDLTVERGELVGLLGPNGAGKSTLVKIACGLVRPSAGRAEVCGARAGTRDARAALGYLLGIAQALVGKPQLLLLDEPTSALDPVGRRTVRALLEELQRRGVSVLLNSHLLSEVELVCDRVAILLAGKVVAAGTPGELASPRGVEIETDRGVAKYADAVRDDVPHLIERLVRDGRSVFGARVLTSTLEEVYVEAVGGQTQ